MSQIAAFNVLPVGKLDDLLDAATPEVETSKKLLFFKSTQRVDRFHDFLQAESTEHEFTHGSGYCFLALLLFFDSLDVPADDYLFPENSKSKQLSEARGYGVSVFDSQLASRTIEFLRKYPIDRERLRQFLLEEHGGEAPEPELIIRARDTLVGWLNEIDETKIGLLTVA